MAEDVDKLWEGELTAGHRWARFGQETAAAELARLRALRQAAGELTPVQQEIVGQTLWPEICNWALLEQIPNICTSIGCGAPCREAAGHGRTVTAERWRRIWSVYLACRLWLAVGIRGGARSHEVLLAHCDPRGETRRHIEELLGARDRLKELYVERFCVCLEAWLDDLPAEGNARLVSLQGAARALEEQILALEPQLRVPFDRMRLDDHSILQPCHHKLFRRYDIILSSIGDGQWRKSMPQRGTDGDERADEMEPHLAALEAWAAGGHAPDTPPAADLYARLGAPDAFKRFAVSLLASLLRAQQLIARRRAAKRRGSA